MVIINLQNSSDGEIDLEYDIYVLYTVTIYYNGKFLFVYTIPNQLQTLLGKII